MDNTLEDVTFKSIYADEQTGLVEGKKQQRMYRSRDGRICTGTDAQRELAHWIQSIPPPSMHTSVYVLYYSRCIIHWCPFLARIIHFTSFHRDL